MCGMSNSFVIPCIMIIYDTVTMPPRAPVPAAGRRGGSGRTCMFQPASETALRTPIDNVATAL